MSCSPYESQVSLLPARLFLYICHKSLEEVFVLLLTEESFSHTAYNMTDFMSFAASWNNLSQPAYPFCGIELARGIHSIWTLQIYEGNCKFPTPSS
jgi:hypothetical protein